MSTPQQQLSQTIQARGERKTFEAIEELGNISIGPRLKIKRAGIVAKNCLDALKEQASGCDLGKVFGFGLLYCDQDDQGYIKDAILTALRTVSQKLGI